MENVDIRSEKVRATFAQKTPFVLRYGISLVVTGLFLLFLVGLIMPIPEKILISIENKTSVQNNIKYQLLIPVRHNYKFREKMVLEIEKEESSIFHDIEITFSHDNVIEINNQTYLKIEVNIPLSVVAKITPNSNFYLHVRYRSFIVYIYDNL